MPGKITIQLFLKNLVFLIIAGILSACDSSRVYDEMKRINNEEWDKKNVVNFNFTITDTASLNTVYLQIRNTTDYPFSNLFLFMITRDPEGKTSKDTLECILAAPDGKWLGKGLGKLKENRIIIKKDIRWMIPGTYEIRVEQAMRKDLLEGISDIGLRIEKE
ncbi:MAG: gliding motility lipoprotein GldH [Bacteroidales bacterium]